jgi:hypothetical protein
MQARVPRWVFVSLDAKDEHLSLVSKSHMNDINLFCLDHSNYSEFMISFFFLYNYWKCFSTDIAYNTIYRKNYDGLHETHQLD